ncbi:hypothetical protein CYMTET_35687 [Cymbomonas tetramitiformis]|uniref:Uncharacterized protein n=1 Tax=Cymbomonas tetramitiformis TaxID=36881 RepID=A0AAE0KP12_9CHLO|nr:hypothetical protein CYMTET_35687 [Cymbomonas tetramitiformis]|eukprot:gene19844-23735_t
MNCRSVTQEASWPRSQDDAALKALVAVFVAYTALRSLVRLPRELMADAVRAACCPMYFANHLSHDSNHQGYALSALFAHVPYASLCFAYARDAMNECTNRRLRHSLLICVSKIFFWGSLLTHSRVYAADVEIFLDMMVTAIEIGHIVRSDSVSAESDVTVTSSALCNQTDVYCAIFWALGFGRFVFLKRRQRSGEILYDTSTELASVESSLERSDDQLSLILFFLYVYQLIRIFAGAWVSNCAFGSSSETDVQKLVALTDAFYFGCAYALADMCVRVARAIS